MMCSKVNGPCGLRIISRSTTFANSRTLPGQAYSRKRSMTPGATSGTDGSLRSCIFSRMKCCKRAGISDLRSRSGGILSGKTLIRNHRSSRNCPALTISSRLQWVAAITRQSTAIVFVPPTRSISLRLQRIEKRTNFKGQLRIMNELPRHSFDFKSVVVITSCLRGKVRNYHI